MKLVKWFIPVLVTTVWSCTSGGISLKIINELDHPQVKYAIEQLEATEERLSVNNLLANKNRFIITTSLNNELKEEAFEISVKGTDIHVAGGDANGIMYGLLHIREQLDSGSNNITNHQESPALSFRAIKFNLPWDSYRRGEALQLHYETCRDTLFWSDFLDMMAENRFNTLTLWNLHPFNYLVKTDKYPEACGFTDQEMKEWKQFWSTLFRMAKNRGIETYLVNWNIFVSPEFARAHGVAEYSIDGTYYVEKGDTSEIIKDYTREVVREVINQYPDLTGLGITLGEGMGGMQAAERQQWLLDTFLEGMRSANRKIKFIHRAPLSAGTGSYGSTDASVERLTRNTLDTLTCTDGPVTIELKFNWSHAYSTPHLVKVHGGELTDAYWNPVPVNYQLAWMMRNEDFFILRWGQPGFIRQHIEYNAHPWVNGYFVGSETYIPAKDYITALPGTSNKYAFERQWMYYKMWGRLLYNPNTPDKTFIQAFENRFPGLGETLFTAQTKVSRVPLIIASYWNATWDYTLYTEGLLFFTHDGTKYRMKLLSLEEMTRRTPWNLLTFQSMILLLQLKNLFRGAFLPLNWPTRWMFFAPMQ
jgi:hypothetical protein